MRVRATVGLIIAGLTLSGLTACGSDIDDSTDDQSPASGAKSVPDGPWQFTDGSGKVIKAKETPTRIIAHAGEAAALMSYGIRPVGIYADEPVETDPNLQGLDLTGIEILGEEWGSIDVAKASTLNPDLIVGDWWPVEEAHSGLENGVKAKSKKLAELAPVVGVSQGESIVDLAQGYEDLAESLGADVDSPELSAEKKRFEEARDEFTAMVESKPGLDALAVSPTTDLLYVANPEYAPELLDFQRWGLDVINPDAPDKAFPYWENLSWENADKYQPDALLIDSRAVDQQLADAEKQPTWNSIKAAEADQIVSWPAFWLHTYGDYADALDDLTAELEKVDESVGDE